MPKQRQHDGGAGEEDGFAGGAAGDLDRVVLGVAAPPFLAVAGDDEQGVVDADGESDHRDHVDDEEGEVHHPAEQGGQADGDDDGDDGEHDRDAGDDEGAEDDDEDHEGGEQPQPLALDQVALGEFGELVVRRRRRRPSGPARRPRPAAR